MVVNASKMPLVVFQLVFTMVFTVMSKRIVIIIYVPCTLAPRRLPDNALCRHRPGPAGTALETFALNRRQNPASNVTSRCCAWNSHELSLSVIQVCLEEYSQNSVSACAHLNASQH